MGKGRTGQISILEGPREGAAQSCRKILQKIRKEIMRRLRSCWWELHWFVPI